MLMIHYHYFVPMTAKTASSRTYFRMVNLHREDVCLILNKVRAIDVFYTNGARLSMSWNPIFLRLLFIL